ncbi:GNAT family N-acetyltransferase [Aquimarina rubra]|uniref:GNAT family N-acetyltransferase n=1 Tax=Aquimarina rubra TaxID=1920033 RepID=A0ABW5LCE6_9FLAO
MTEKDQIEISKRKAKLDIPLIHQFITNSYWVKGRTIKQVKTSINNSECFGLYLNGKQIGFARVISDKVVFAYIMDVFVINNERDNGYASQLMNHILNDKNYNQVQQWCLKTKDAHNFYSKFGFKNLDNEQWFLQHILE